MLTVRQLIDKVVLPDPTQSILIRGLVRMIPQETLDKTVGMKIDEQARTIAIEHGGNVVFQAGFDEVNTYGGR